MAEAVAVFGLVAAIAQLIEYAGRLTSRLNDISGNLNGLTSLRARVEAITTVTNRIRSQLDRHVLGVAESTTLLHIIADCSCVVEKLLTIIEKLLPKKTLGKVDKVLRAARSLSQDKEVGKLSLRLSNNLQIISLLQTTALLDTASLTRPSDDAGGFVVKHTAELHNTRSQPTSEVDPDAAFLDSEDRILTSQTTGGSPCDDDNASWRTPQDSKESLSEGATDLPRSQKGLTSAHHTDVNNRCGSSCSCTCHRLYEISTPNMFSWLLGRASITSTNYPATRLPCSEKGYAGNKSSVARLTYQPPLWLLPTAVNLSLTSRALNTHINLNTLRVLPDTAEVFAVVSRGDITRLQQMFAQKQASIYDVSRSNWTSVHTAFTLGRLDIVNFLVQEGADVNISANNGSNVIERAWFHAQKTTAVPGDYVLSENQILQSIDIDEFVSQQQYSLIHKIVLGISKLSLSDVLQASTAQIDQQDWVGATPLWWASAQGNTLAIQTLLAFGADQNIGAAMSQTPLHVARDVATVQLLCANGARIDAVDTLGRQPLHCYCYRQKGASPQIVRAILRHGADVSAVANGRQTPLHYAVMFDNSDLIPILLKAGSDINARMRGGLTPLLAALRRDQSRSLRVLLRSGASVMVTIDAGEGVYQTAARWASVS